MTGLASLRCWDPDTLRAIAAGGGPRYVNDFLHVGCPLCACALSGDALEPNTVCEWCDNAHCPCHQEEA